MTGKYSALKGFSLLFMLFLSLFAGIFAMTNPLGGFALTIEIVTTLFWALTIVLFYVYENKIFQFFLNGIPKFSKVSGQYKSVKYAFLAVVLIFSLFTGIVALCNHLGTFSFVISLIATIMWVGISGLFYAYADTIWDFLFKNRS